VEWTEFTTHDDGPLIAGRRAGSGPPVLLLHGGPGLGFDYLRDLADELAEENDVAWYQQRGQEPSAAEGPYTVAADVEDARRFLDALGWEKAYVVGHSWGGQLALHVAEAMPERLLGVLAVDPLGSIGDGRWPEFDEEMFRRTPEDVRERARELDELSMAGEADDELALEGMRLVWPAYFADPEHAPPMPELRIATARSAEMVPSIQAELPALEAGLPGIRVPVGFVHGSRSPMPVAASTDAAERIPGAWVEVVEGAGHFVWVEAPGAVPAALRRLTAGAADGGYDR
jgi:pimeloyl-ACP methyl ester carboxylesterase